VLSGYRVSLVTPYTDKLLAAFMERNSDAPTFTFFQGKSAEELARDAHLAMWLWLYYGDPQAYGHLEFSPRLGKAHVCRFGVCVDRDARGQGLGTQVVARLLEEAQARGKTKVNASVYADNAPMLRIYLDKYGFVQEGRFVDEERLDGASRDVLSLAKFL
jgi:RimJ/RimL family protein N-acetyltransferase